MGKLIQKHIITILKLYAFWFLVFTFMRILFSIIYLDKLKEVDFTDWLGIFYHSIRLDLAMSAILIAPLLLWILLKPFGIKLLKWPFMLWQIVAILVCCFIHSAEINAYSEWNHKLTSRVFTHLSNPDEVFRTAEYTQTLFFILYVILELQFARIIWRWLFGKTFFNLSEIIFNWKEKISFSFITLIFLLGGVIFMRGGLQQIPINMNSAMFSNNYVLNDLSVNSTYFFAKSYLLHNRENVLELYPKIDAKEGEKRVENLYAVSSSHENYFIKDTKPNVVIILLESWTSNAISALSNLENTTPNFDKLASEGYLFSNVYACGGTSEIGNASIFSGYPAIPEVSITMHPEKARSLPSINQDLEQVGYRSGYVFSGDLKYGNIGGYLLDHGFQDLKDEDDFPSDLPRGKLNYYDEALYDFLIQRINKTPEPFLHCAFTGSTHSPFDQPKSKKNSWVGNEKDFMNSLIYADEELGTFIENCKKEDWYKNTLFVFIADHGHVSPQYGNPSDIHYFQIPMLFYGEVLKPEYIGKTNNKMASQADFASTLLKQLRLDNAHYKWSKDLMNPDTKEFILHTIAGGYGYKSKEGTYALQVENNYVLKDSISEEGRLNSVALINALYQDFQNH